MGSPMRSAIMMTAMLALMGSGEPGAPELPRLPEPKPKGYGVHLSKPERRGKSFIELQVLREERMNA